MPEPQGTSTRPKRPSRPLWEGHSYAYAIVETVWQPLLVLDKDLRVASANRSFYDTFRVSPQETQGRLIYELGAGSTFFVVLPVCKKDAASRMREAA